MNTTITIDKYNEYLTLGDQFKALQKNSTESPMRKVWENAASNLRYRVLWWLRSELKKNKEQFSFSEEVKKWLLEFSADAKLDDQQLEALFSGLAKLKHLSLRKLELKRFEFSPYLTDLEEIALSDNTFEDMMDFAPLKGSLKRIYCLNLNLENLYFLEGFQNLEKLYCGLNKLKSLETVSMLENLKLLNIRGNKISKAMVQQFRAKKGSCVVQM